MNGRAKAIRCIKANAQPILLPRALARPDLHGLGIDHSRFLRRYRRFDFEGVHAMRNLALVLRQI
jgi:hypothetical protein